MRPPTVAFGRASVGSRVDRLRRSSCLCWISWLGVVGTVTAGCEPPDNSPRGRGARVFQRNCASCHGRDGRGAQAIGLVKPPRDLTRADFHARVTDDELLRTLQVGKGQMPAFGGLM